MTGTFLFSGIEKTATAQAVVEEQAAGMISFWRATPALLDACSSIKTLVIDSGIYSKPHTQQDIERYAEFIIRLGERCLWYAMPDVIGDQVQSNKNYEKLLSLLPKALHERILWIYQQSAPHWYLIEGLEQHKRIGIGGLVPLIQRDSQQARNRIVEIAREVAGAGVSGQYFGNGMRVSHIDLQEIHRDTDFSVDATTWLVGSRYGRLVNAAGQQIPMKETGFDFSTHACLQQNIRTMRKWVEKDPISLQRTLKHGIQHTLLGV